MKFFRFFQKLVIIIVEFNTYGVSMKTKTICNVVLFGGLILGAFIAFPKLKADKEEHKPTPGQTQYFPIEYDIVLPMNQQKEYVAANPENPNAGFRLAKESDTGKKIKFDSIIKTKIGTEFVYNAKNLFCFGRNNDYGATKTIATDGKRFLVSYRVSSVDMIGPIMMSSENETRSCAGIFPLVH